MSLLALVLLGAWFAALVFVFCLCRAASWSESPQVATASCCRSQDAVAWGDVDVDWQWPAQAGKGHS